MALYIAVVLILASFPCEDDGRSPRQSMWSCRTVSIPGEKKNSKRKTGKSEICVQAFPSSENLSLCVSAEPNFG